MTAPEVKFGGMSEIIEGKAKQNKYTQNKDNFLPAYLLWLSLSPLFIAVCLRFG